VLEVTSFPDLLLKAPLGSRTWRGRLTPHRLSPFFVDRQPQLSKPRIFVQGTSSATGELENDVPSALRKKKKLHFVQYSTPHSSIVAGSGPKMRRGMGMSGQNLVQSWAHDQTECPIISMICVRSFSCFPFALEKTYNISRDDGWIDRISEIQKIFRAHLKSGALERRRKVQK
jgi:hypothetical protein